MMHVQLITLDENEHLLRPAHAFGEPLVVDSTRLIVPLSFLANLNASSVRQQRGRLLVKDASTW